MDLEMFLVNLFSLSQLSALITLVQEPRTRSLGEFKANRLTG